MLLLLAIQNIWTNENHNITNHRKIADLSEVWVVVQHGWLEQVGLAHLEAACEGREEESDVLEAEELREAGPLVDQAHVHGGGVDGVQQVAQQHAVPHRVGQVLHRGVRPAYSETYEQIGIMADAGTGTGTAQVVTGAKWGSPTCGLKAALPVSPAILHTASTALPLFCLKTVWFFIIIAFNKSTFKFDRTLHSLDLFNLPDTIRTYT